MQLLFNDLLNEVDDQCRTYRLAELLAEGVLNVIDYYICDLKPNHPKFYPQMLEKIKSRIYNDLRYYFKQ